MTRGPSQAVRQAVAERDRHRCKFCGVVRPCDIHHIEFRRSSKDDTPRNLILLCRGCHDRLHQRLPKFVAQDLLRAVLGTSDTALALLRREPERWSVIKERLQ